MGSGFSPCRLQAEVVPNTVETLSIFGGTMQSERPLTNQESLQHNLSRPQMDLYTREALNGLILSTHPKPYKP